MLSEARRRIRADSEIASSSTKLDLVRCDVARIPMKSNSIDVFHAGAAMHCWPEIEASLKEIHRVLIPGGRYFATTFLSNYFANLANVEKASNGGNDFEQKMQAFQYFPSKEYVKDLLVDAGFEESKVAVEVLGRACVIIRCEK
jgi:ubiquinone/menaquinone biosynthesis C-methylase UbiE